MGMGDLGHFDETHKTGSTHDGLLADAAHASLPSPHCLLLVGLVRLQGFRDG